MKKTLSIILFVLGCFAVGAQYYLIIENRTASIIETNIRFFSYFTILTNLMVLAYFTAETFQLSKGLFSFRTKPENVTAITVYITVVGLVYQVVLRPIWTPTGIQMVVNELLHSLIPILVIVYWFVTYNNSTLRYRQLWGWLGYPFVYLVFILVRGSLSHFYPYPFVDVDKLGIQTVLVNSLLVTGVFAIIAVAFIAIGKRTPSR